MIRGTGYYQLRQYLESNCLFIEYQYGFKEKKKIKKKSLQCYNVQPDSLHLSKLVRSKDCFMVCYISQKHFSAVNPIILVSKLHILGSRHQSVLTVTLISGFLISLFHT